MARYAPRDVMRHYLQDALAAEEQSEHQLRACASDARRDPVLRDLFLQHAEETRRQAAWLRMRLDTLHGSPSGVKSLRAQLAGIGPRMAHLGHDGVERVSQDLLAAFTMECSEIALYEALAVAAVTAGDRDTERLARGIQKEERRTADRLWGFLARSMRETVVRMIGVDGSKAGQVAERTPTAAYPGTSEMPEYPGPSGRIVDEEEIQNRIAAFMYSGADPADSEDAGPLYVSAGGTPTVPSEPSPVTANGHGPHTEAEDGPQRLDPPDAHLRRAA